jgi:hypothetical protein
MKSESGGPKREVRVLNVIFLFLVYKLQFGGGFVFKRHGSILNVALLFWGIIGWGLLESSQKFEDCSSDRHSCNGQSGSAQQTSPQQRKVLATSIKKKLEDINLVKLGTGLLLLGLDVIQGLGDGGSQHSRETSTEHRLERGCIMLCISKR